VPLGVTDEITERGFKYTFRLVNNATQAATNTAEFVRQLIEGQAQRPSSFAMMHENTAFGSSTAPKVAEALKALGLNQVEMIPYAPTTTDLSTEVARLKAAKPDLFLTNGYFNDGLLLARTIKEQRFESLANIGVIHGAFATPGFVDQLGKDAEYYFNSGSGFDPNDPRTNQLKEAFKARFNADIENLGIQSLQMGYVLGDALERAASIDPQMIRDALATTNLQNVVSPLVPDKVVRFDDKGQSVNVNLILFQTQNGAAVNVLPAKYANGKAIYPTPGWGQRG
jgi:branched-chain amino acid transport system substrate-binding protein